MKTVFALSLLAFLMPSVASADGPAPPLPTYLVLEQSNLVTEDGLDPNMNGLAFKLFTPRFGLFSAFYVDRTYASTYLGPAVAPAKWAILGCGAGIETTGETAPWRAGCVAWLGSETLSVLVFAETGASGPWGRIEANWKPFSWIGVGALADLELGAGPRLELSIPKLPFQAWYATVGTGNGDVSHLLGFRLTL